MRFDPNRPIKTSRPWRIVHRVSGWGIRGLRTASGILFLMIGIGFVIAAVGSAITGVLGVCPRNNVLSDMRH